MTTDHAPRHITETSNGRLETSFNDVAPVYGERRPWSELPASDRDWWESTLREMHTVATAAWELPAEARDRVISAGAGYGDLESAISAQRGALEAMRS